jgi:DNA-binding transcriptional ArsR family regulator
MLDLPDIDSILHGLADPTRRGIVEKLTSGPASVSSLAGALPMTLQAAMQHIAVLETAGLVRSEKIGRVRTVTLNPDALRRLQAWVVKQKTVWDRRLDRIGDLLGESPENEKE